MNREISLEVFNIRDFFNNIEESYSKILLNLPHIKEEIFLHNNEKVSILKVEIQGSYHKKEFFLIENQIKDFDIFTLIKSLKNSQLLKKSLLTSIYDLDFKERNILFIGSENNNPINDIIEALRKINSDEAIKIKNRYEDFCVNHAKEVQFYEHSILTEPFLLFEHLIKNKSEKKEYTIEISSHSSEEEISKWFSNIEKIKSKEENIEGFCDLDYSPFIYKDNLFIEDSSSGKILFCDIKDKNNFTWYILENDFDCKDDLLRDALNESNQYLQKIINEKTYFNQVLQVKNGEVVACTHDLLFIHSLQNYIVKSLVNRGEIISPTISLSFKELLANFTMQNEVWNIEERAFFDIFPKLVYHDNKLSYENFIFIRPKFHQIRHEDPKFVNKEYLDRSLTSSPP